MHWVTILWSAIAATCLTMGMVHGLAWLWRKDNWASLMFALLAAGTAALAIGELYMLKAQTVEAYGAAARWSHVPVWIAFLALVGFVRFYLRAGRAWLAWSACGLRTLSLIINFTQTPNVNYREITALGQVPFLGETITVAEGLPNPWMLIAQFSLLLLIVFLLDAAVTVWRRGERMRALSVGGGLILFVVAGTITAVLSFWRIAHIPFVATPFILAIVATMGYELSRDLLRAATLSRALIERDAQLRDSEEQLTLAAEAADAGLWSLEIPTMQVWTTPKMREMLGLAPGHAGELEGYLERIHPADQPRVRRAIDEALGSGQPFRVDYRVLYPDQGVRWLVSQGRLQRNDNDEPGKLMGVSVDITSRKAAEEEALRQRAELAHLSRVASLSELSGSLAHEINQPLATILSNAQAGQLILAEASPDLAELRDILADIVSEDQRAAEVIRSLRAMLERGEPERRPLELNELVEEALRLAVGDLNRGGVLVELDLDPNLPPIAGDRIPLEQMMLNLVFNARDAMSGNAEGDRRLVLATRRLDATVRLSISDNGCGLPANSSSIFKAFFTTKASGLGMGLAISRSIAAAHGGRLWAEANPDRGTTFHLSLPVGEDAS